MKKTNYRWRPASWNVGANGKPTVVVNPPPAPAPIVVTEKSSGGTIAIVLGIGAIAFAALELAGVTHVFSPLPAVPPLPTPAPGTTGGAAPAAGTVPPAGTSPVTPVK